MIYTTYFAKLNKLPVNIVPISICVSVPGYYNGLQYKKIAPTYDLLARYKKDGDTNYYTEYFNEKILGHLDPYFVMSELYDMTDGKDVALVCYERSDAFCHRHLVAEWFRNNGIECEEYVY